MDQLLLDTLRDIRAEVSQIRVNQEAFMVKSSERLATLETRMDTHGDRLAKIERHLERTPRHWTIKRWAAVVSVTGTVLASVVKILMSLKHPTA